METLAIEASTTGITKLLNSEIPVVALLVVLIVVLAWLVWKLYGKNENLAKLRMDQFKEELVRYKEDLKYWKTAQAACEVRTRRLAQAVIDAIGGKTHEARALARTVIEESQAESDDDQSRG